MDFWHWELERKPRVEPCEVWGRAGDVGVTSPCDLVALPRPFTPPQTPLLSSGGRTGEQTRRGWAGCREVRPFPAGSKGCSKGMIPGWAQALPSPALRKKGISGFRGNVLGVGSSASCLPGSGPAAFPGGCSQAGMLPGMGQLQPGPCCHLSRFLGRGTDISYSQGEARQGIVTNTSLPHTGKGLLEPPRVPTGSL